MLRTFSYLIGKGVTTSKDLFPPLPNGARGLPMLTSNPCSGSTCSACVECCPTDAVSVSGERVALDLGACIGCGACVQACPTKTIENNSDTKTSKYTREGLILSNSKDKRAEDIPSQGANAIFKNSLAIRVVSTGCSACDLEIGAAGNPIFDMERFGVSVVASPRFADALLVTGPVPKAMHEPLKRCYEAMAEPRVVVAVGTCAISGGLHRDGYAMANGAGSVIPVDVFIPGCPPHPWSIIYGVSLAMAKKL